tara:strand:- start:408 stop:896 length:489 start_codon:yes stop_codon:yes gene_type:complete
VKLAKKVLLVFALLVVIGGIQGMMAGSAASLIAAVISGALLLYSRWLWGEKNLPGLIVGLVVSIALLGRFASVAIKDGLDMWPGGTVILFSVVTIVVLIAAFLQEKKSASGSQEVQPAGEASVDDAGQAESGKAEVEEAEEDGTATTTESEEAEEAESSEDA